MKLTSTIKALLLAAGFSVSGLAISGPNIVGTIPVSKAQKAHYAHLAKVSLADAKATALKEVKGTIQKAKLEEEDGYLVYTIDIITDKGVEHEVVVDAGNGKVLANEID